MQLKWNWSRLGIKWGKPKVTAAEDPGFLGGFLDWPRGVKPRGIFPSGWEWWWWSTKKNDGYSLKMQGHGWLQWSMWKSRIIVIMRCSCHQEIYKVQFFICKPSKSLPGILTHKWNAWSLIVYRIRGKKAMKNVIGKIEQFWIRTIC